MIRSGGRRLAPPATPAFKALVAMFRGDANIDDPHVMHRRLKAAKTSSGPIVSFSIDHQRRESTMRTEMLAKNDAFVNINADAATSG